MNGLPWLYLGLVLLPFTCGVKKRSTCSLTLYAVLGDLASHADRAWGLVSDVADASLIVRPLSIAQ
jgi:hypothetical protein